jgi:O-methyltransferase domain
MTSLSAMGVVAAVEAYDFSRFGRVVDVGGAHGSLLAAILARHPAVHGVLFDQPGVIAGAGELLRAVGVADRCELVGGSFFESVPGGGDAYVMKSVLHDWLDAEAARILAACVGAMEPGAVLLLVEQVVEPPNEGAIVKLSDLNMLVAAGGRERTLAEWESLLASAGLRLERTVPTWSTFSVIEAVLAD